ncbi:hypothetical protein PILCRDRAFT_123420 [Piloderma croceum F 1598]|uniref:Uncharacterized protein n=1 Tax=Piloderma croceum (strain F 1598) TaxID=765440 RepID=A0A0C3GLI8_PILCF|nr:hypothetical protein PILCRDRAFT_123420 [Piloderma croceum F 1598]
MNWSSLRKSSCVFFDPSQADQSLVVLSQRLCLDIHFGHPDAAEYLDKAVCQSHASMHRDY